MSIDVFEASIKNGLFINASSDINIDIVNPIPAINETKNTATQLILLGLRLYLIYAHPKKLKSIIPKGLPKQRAKIIPIYKLETSELNIFILDDNVSPVLAKANKGIINKLLIGTNNI